MTEAIKDANGVPTALGVLNSDGVTPSLIGVEPTNHGIEVDDNTTGSDLSGDIAHRDRNGETVLMGVSSVDGVTPVEVYVMADYKLLINSN